MKILFISYHFGPSNTIAAVRTTKIVKYLQRAGHDVEVICGPFHNIDPILERDIIEIHKIHRVNDSNLNNLASNIAQEQNNGKSLKRKLYILLKDFIKGLMRNQTSAYLDIYNSIVWFRKTKNIIKSCTKECDAVIASYGPLGSSLAGLFAKKTKPSIILINDQRDTMIPDTIFGIIRFIHYYYMINLLRKSDITFCISNGLKEFYLNICKKHKFKKYNDIYVITNGYDQEDLDYLKLNNKADTKNEYKNKLILSYCGSLYRGQSDLSPLFKMIAELYQNGNIDLDNIELNYAGNDFDILLNQAEKYNISRILKNYGFVTRDESLNITKNSDISIVASWNTKRQKGILTGKLFELLLLKKYIFAFVSGDCENSEIKDLIKRCNTGFVYEENDNKSYLLMKDVLLMHYYYKLENHEIKTRSNIDVISQYNYNNIAELIINIMKYYSSYNKNSSEHIL